MRKESKADRILYAAQPCSKVCSRKSKEKKCLMVEAIELVV